LIAEVFRFCAEDTPAFNPISISGYHIREAGATAVQELAFTFANGLTYVQQAVDAGLAVNAFAPRLSFFFACHSDLFEEVAKFRAARRIWARLMRARYAGDDAACKLRFHTQTGGVTLTAQQPLNNVVRVAVQTLAATLGGTQSLHTNGYDEALALPTAESATLALRTQQIVAHESGVAQTADPLAGSWYVEALTDEVERRTLELLAQVEALGGAAAAIEARFFHEEIGRSAYEHQLAVEQGSRVIVGVNQFTDGAEPPIVPAPDFRALEAGQRERVAAVRAKRDKARVTAALAAIRAAAPGYAKAGAPRAPLMPLIVAAVRARATVGEISDELRAVWGEYHPG
jgi:methylmalonyl-CoA mutase N-terminal domain/subunit